MHQQTLPTLILCTTDEGIVNSLCIGHRNSKEFENRNKMAEAEGGKQNNKQVKKRTRNPSGRYF